MGGAGSADANKRRGAGIDRLLVWFGTSAVSERVLVAVGILAVLIGTLPSAISLGPAVTVACVAIALAFACLYVVRLRLAEDRRRHALSLPAIVDLIAAVPIPLALILGVSSGNARLFGILWALKLVRLNPAFALLGRVLRNERQPLVSVTMAFVVVALLAATLAFLFERGAQPEVFGSVPAALWWAVTTITTTGYGDKIPVSFFGRVLATVVMVSGIGLFALWAGILASGFSQELRRREFLESWDLVVRLPFFRNLGAASLAEIARLLKVRNYATEAVIMRTGQPGDSMYFIAEGEVEVRVGADKIRLKPGQFFGETALITGASRNATVVAASPTRLLRLDVVEFRDLAARQPELLASIEAESARRKGGPA
jgi:voltage-gated potassium channel